MKLNKNQKSLDNERKLKRRARRSNGGNRNQGGTALLRPMQLSNPLVYTGCGPATPGRAKLKSVIEIFNDSKVLYASYGQFDIWFGQARNVLSPFKYWRITDLQVEALVNGGAASPYSVAFNVSNSTDGDSSFGAVMNDDYSGLCTAMSRPVLHPPRHYWRESQMPWYQAKDQTGGVPPNGEVIAGAISAWGTGGALSTTVIGWLVIDIEIEYHTLE
jgi:hypothetical protein